MGVWTSRSTSFCSRWDRKYGQLELVRCVVKQSIPAINDDVAPVVVLCDREKGIYNAAKEQLPHNQHCYCVKHIEKNLKTRFKIDFVEKLWLAAKTLSVPVFNDTMSQIKRTHRSAFEFLNAIEKEAWTRLYSTLPRFGHVTSNVAQECFNSWIDSARDESHFLLVVSITRQIMTLWYQRRTSYSNMASLVPRSLQKEFNDVMERSGSLNCFPVSEDKFLVVSGRSEYTLDTNVLGALSDGCNKCSIHVGLLVDVSRFLR
jgi:hypothetical protein